MDAVYAWVGDQRERNRNDFYRFLDQQRAKWTPRHVVTRCCVKWLADGNFTSDPYADQYSFRNGCQGRCGREHPVIILSFDAERNTTIATVSHSELSPFQRYFQERMNDNTAWVHDRSSYDLDGFIRENQTRLRAQQHFGAHLVTIANGALEASDAAQRRQKEEEEERPVKRAKTSTSLTTDVNMLKKVMDTTLLECLGKELDLISLYCMRQTSRLFRTVATQIATSRLKAAKFHITPLVDGIEQFGDDKFDGFDSETWEVNGHPAEEDGGLCKYKKRDHVVLECLSDKDSDEERLGEATFVPSDPSKAEFSWVSPYLYDYVDENERSYKTSRDAYCGQTLRVFWHPETADGVEEKPHVGMYDEVLPSLGVVIGRFYTAFIDGAPSTGLHVKTRNGVTVEFEVLESSEQSERDEDKPVNEDEPGSEDEQDNEDASHNQCISFSGRARIVKLKVDFGTLVQHHAVQLFQKVKREHARIERERPLKASEVAYLQRIEAAVKSL